MINFLSIKQNKLSRIIVAKVSSFSKRIQVHRVPAFAIVGRFIGILFSANEARIKERKGV